ncbi:MAG TPA: SUMF1/EgtB/PvdO family nonheme iron enzyme, partial [Stellaceae bacterium]|nr:SUMF1/EgtB/PvdO family nonheme iron enzyme [Stellaceae bacterium]
VAAAEPTPSDASRNAGEQRTAAANTLPPPAAARGDQATFRDCPECPLMVRIAAGSFAMGLASGDVTAEPVRTVTVRAFALGQRPVSVGEWKACVAQGGCASVPRMADDEHASMHNLSWDDTQRYVAWLAKKTGHRYRLPSEAEWEYAARGRTTTHYWWGDQVGVGLANCSDCGGKQQKDAPLPVEDYKPNPFGLLGVHGGVAQWVADCWFPNYHGAPSDAGARDRKGCDSRVLRGGSFRNDHNNITSAVRNYYDASVRYTGNGFRVAADIE